MFRIHYSRTKGLLLFNRDSTITTTFFFITRSICADDNFTPHNSFTISYLLHSCGLSKDKAISISKKVQFESSAKPDSVLALFRNHGFPNTHISKIVEKRPLLLLAKVDKTLQPKLEFFNSIGLSGTDLAKVISGDPNLLKISLEKKIIPSIAFLKTILVTDTNVVTVFKRSTWILRGDPLKRLAPNIAILRTHGVPDYNVAKLLVLNARTLLRADRFNEIVEEAKKMKFDPSESAFVRAISVLSGLSKSSWEVKFNIYKMWGWSEENILMAFKKLPQCMMVSEKKIVGIMEFVVNKMGYDPILFAKDPFLLTLSLEKRIIPRLSIIQVLVTNGLVEKDHHIGTILKVSDKDFLKRFVTKNEEKVRQVLNAYR